MRTIVLLLVCLAPALVHAEEAKVFKATFDEGPRPMNWSVNFGAWDVHRGALNVRQLAEDNHAAASRWRIPLTDAVVRCKVQLGNARQFHVGFDPQPGALKKKGHLYSLILTEGKAVIKKHRDKSDEKSTDEVLASAEIPVSEWTQVELRAEGDRVEVLIGESTKLTATDPSFHVAKPGVVFRVAGEALVDDVEVTVLK